MGKRHGKYESSKYKELQDDFEDFGYEVKNIRRQSKKKVNKFKREVDEYYDSYWTGTLVVASLDFLCQCIRVNTTPTLMRKIEQQMNSAIANCKDWRSGNTEVVNCNDMTYVYLHGNHICTLGDDFVKIFDGGWQSNTTKSRLNAIINQFCNAFTDGVFQKDFVWYVMDSGKQYQFINGYEFRAAWYN